jgi:hypothetical protein
VEWEGVQRGDAAEPENQQQEDKSTHEPLLRSLARVWVTKSPQVSASLLYRTFESEKV